MPRNEIALRAPIKSKKASNVPGDTRRILTEEAETVGGNWIEVGTVFQPQSAGFDNIINARVQRVVLLDE